jgi:uncharacterized lipoprotein YmbA
MRIIKQLLIISGLFVIAACSSTKETISRYYVIERPDDIQISNNSENPIVEGSCEITPVEIYPAFATSEIANRSGSHEIIYYRFHHWAVPPGETLTLLLENYFNTSVFDRASTRFWKTRPGFKLETTVYQLEVVQEKEALSAHLALEFKLFSNTDDILLVKHEADRMEKLQDQDLNLFAETIGKLFHEELNNLAQTISERIPDLQKKAKQQ